jgi:pimeloyl-ACP methyl ester carboxylesterase
MVAAMDAVLRGLRHRYVVEGQGDAPVLLVMGFGFSGKAWRPQVAAFAPRHPVVWYDNRGVGESEPASSPYGIEDLADDAAALLDHLSWARAHVVGVSMGGMVAQELALRHRARLRSLTLIATMAGGRLGKLPTARGLAWFAAAQLRQGPGRLEALARLLYPPGTQPEPGVIQPGFERPPPRQTIGWQLRAILRHETRARLSSLAGLPTLVVKPARDILVRPGHSDVLHRAIPGSRLVTFDDAGHGITAQCATRLNAALLAHFAEADARA